MNPDKTIQFNLKDPLAAYAFALTVANLNRAGLPFVIQQKTGDTTLVSIVIGDGY